MAISNNKISQWVNTDVVDAAQMNDFTQDLYQRLSAMTDFSANRYPNDYRQGVILAVSGTITQSGRTVSVGNSSSGAAYAAAVRFPTNNSPSVLQPGNGVFGFLPFGNAPQGNTITVPTGSTGYVIINYTITPPSSNTYATNLVVPSLLFITTGNLSSYPNCVVVATILSNGNIDQNKKPNYLITQAADANDIAALANNVALTPALYPIPPTPGRTVQILVFPTKSGGSSPQTLNPPSGATGVFFTATAFGGDGGPGNNVATGGTGGSAGAGVNKFYVPFPLAGLSVSYTQSGGLIIPTNIATNGLTLGNGVDGPIGAVDENGKDIINVTPPGTATYRQSLTNSYTLTQLMFSNGGDSIAGAGGTGGVSLVSPGLITPGGAYQQPNGRVGANGLSYGAGGGGGSPGTSGGGAGGTGGVAIVIAEWVF